MTNRKKSAFSVSAVVGGLAIIAMLLTGCADEKSGDGNGDRNRNRDNRFRLGNLGGIYSNGVLIEQAKGVAAEAEMTLGFFAIQPQGYPRNGNTNRNNVNRNNGAYGYTTGANLPPLNGPVLIGGEIIFNSQVNYHSMYNNGWGNQGGWGIQGRVGVNVGIGNRWNQPGGGWNQNRNFPQQGNFNNYQYQGQNGMWDPCFIEPHVPMRVEMDQRQGPAVLQQGYFDNFVLYALGPRGERIEMTPYHQGGNYIVPDNVANFKSFYSTMMVTRVDSGAFCEQIPVTFAPPGGGGGWWF